MSFQYADWPLPEGVCAGWSDRLEGVSAEPFNSMNLGRHVGDAAENVEANRARLNALLKGQPNICWLNQTHSTTVVPVAEADPGCGQDGSYSTEPNQACCVMTADCLPVFFWQQDGQKVAIAHAGWRGLADGILAETLKRFDDPSSISCGIGPAISQPYFEVGEDVYNAFAGWVDHQTFFIPRQVPGKYSCDLPGLAVAQLTHLGVRTVHLSGLCSYAQAERFYSYRRDGQTGRMANLIWLTE